LRGLGKAERLLADEVNQWRVRVGDWRIVYRIEDGRLVVMVITVAPRGGVYR
jgi:mRNA interferase RelE/StbE